MLLVPGFLFPPASLLTTTTSRYKGLPCGILWRSDSHTGSDVILSCSQPPVIRVRLFGALNISRTLCVMSVGLFPSSTPEGNWDIVSRPLSFHRSRFVWAVHIPRRNNILVFFVWGAV